MALGRRLLFVSAILVGWLCIRDDIVVAAQAGFARVQIRVDTRVPVSMSVSLCIPVL